MDGVKPNVIHKLLSACGDKYAKINWRELQPKNKVFCPKSPNVGY